ncbi:dolichol monophosphate mannose synthase [Thermoplasma volcanium GSS1]|uniref:Dolichol monophosphate mannose synthase n=1 Tax=Thermoplasma volcanium (strain ATCC 51530 / DSM 4299 / JCM 9571 / NBRC 15438 / GSS1) TaxID=273116 RepID=Q97AA8_THEVO|nr:glycosyltransferase [Thermoplasma volcanium]BAB60044.1 dolichol monophosphate mannose synthase [Thermoplasma volcanium GSS1]
MDALVSTKANSIAYQRSTVIIPAYNEEKRLMPVLYELCEYIRSNSLEWKVMVSIDGDDGTESNVKIMMQEYSFLSYSKGKGRGGKGAAIKRAITSATGEFVILMDADGSVPLKEIVKALDLTNYYDLIIFDRYSNRGNRIPFIRRFPSRGFNKLVRIFLGLKINDTQCGYKIIKREYAQRAFNKITISNAFFDVALLYYLKKERAKYIEIPVEYNYDRNSKFHVVELVLGEGISLIAFRIRNSRFYKYVPEKLISLYYRKFRWI